MCGYRKVRGVRGTPPPGKVKRIKFTYTTLLPPGQTQLSLGPSPSPLEQFSGSADEPNIFEKFFSNHQNFNLTIIKLTVHQASRVITGHSIWLICE